MAGMTQASEEGAEEILMFEEKCCNGRHLEIAHMYS
jgi:hypothetical protein